MIFFFNFIIILVDNFREWVFFIFFGGFVDYLWFLWEGWGVVVRLVIFIFFIFVYLNLEVFVFILDINFFINWWIFIVIIGEGFGFYFGWVMFIWVECMNCMGCFGCVYFGFKFCYWLIVVESFYMLWLYLKLKY